MQRGRCSREGLEAWQENRAHGFLVATGIDKNTQFIGAPASTPHGCKSR
jgi:hypothetical protein